MSFEKVSDEEIKDQH